MFAFPNLLACFYFELILREREREKSKSRPGTPVAISCACSMRTKSLLRKRALPCPERDDRTMTEPVGCFIVPDGCGILSNVHSPESKEQRALLFGSFMKGGNPVPSPTVQFMINKLCDQ